MEAKKNQRYRARIHFTKNGDLRFLGHRDLIRTLERLFRKAGINLAMSEGFHPRPRMSFPAALGVGTAGLNEVMDLELASSGDANELIARLRQCSLPGLEFDDLEMLDESDAKLKAESVWFEFPVPAELQDEVSHNIEQFMANDAYWVIRKSRRQKVNIRPHVLQLLIDHFQLRMQLVVTHEATVRPQEIIEILGLAESTKQGKYLTRTAIQLQKKEHK